jgi:hypothetical protein
MSANSYIKKVHNIPHHQPISNLNGWFLSVWPKGLVKQPQPAPLTMCTVRKLEDFWCLLCSKIFKRSMFVYFLFLSVILNTSMLIFTRFVLFNKIKLLIFSWLVKKA